MHSLSSNTRLRNSGAVGMFAVVRIKKIEEAYLVEYILGNKLEQVRISAGVLEKLNPQALILFLNRVAIDRSIQKNKGRLVRKWN